MNVTKTHLFCLLALLASCGQPPPASRTAFTAGLVPGHEELTRLALERANAELSPHSAPFYPTLWPGEPLRSTRNPLIRGNLATDYPDEVPEFDLKGYLHASRAQNWHLAPELQDIHFLRNSAPRGLSLTAACRAGKARIVQATRDAAEAYSTDPERAFLLLGHATHTLQDGFAPAHVRRSGPQLRKITDICVFVGLERPSGACQPPLAEHITLDNIWLTTRPDPGHTEAAMTPAARAAVAATTRFLVTFADLMATRGDPAEALDEFFTTPREGGGGAFLCP